PQFPSFLHVVGRIEYLRDVLGGHLLFKSPNIVAFVEELEVELSGGLRTPEPERVHGLRTKSGYRSVMGHGHDILGVYPLMEEFTGFGDGLHHLSVEFDFVQMLLPVEFPRIGVAKPVVGNFDLCAVDDLLSEDAVFIAYPVSVGRYRHGSHRVEKAGSKPPQTSVAESGILLFGKYPGKIVSE